MLYPLHLLIAEPEEAPRIHVLPLRAWRPLLLVPRQLCLFEAIPCAEVRWFELPGFVRLQVQRLSPFARSGASALRRGGRLMLWIWDEDEVDGLINGAGGISGTRTSIAEAMYIPTPADGESVRRCTQVDEALLVQDGAVLRSSLLQARALDETALVARARGCDWAAFGGTASAGLLARVGGGVGLFNRLAWLTAVAALGWASFQGAALWSGERAVLTLEAKLAERVSDGGSQLEERRRLEADQQWLQDYARAVTELDIPALLETLRPVLEAHGVVIREWSSSADNVKLVLATAGGEIRLPELTRDLAGVRGIQGLQLLQHEDLNAVSYAFQPSGWMRRDQALSVPAEGQR